MIETWSDVNKLVQNHAEGQFDFTAPYRDLKVVSMEGSTALSYKEAVYPMDDYAIGQLCSKLEIPTKYFRRLPTDMRETVAAFDLRRFARSKDALVRVHKIGGVPKVRAFLSDGYAPVDNAQIVTAVQAVLERVEHKIRAADINPSGMWAKVTVPGLAIEDPTKQGSPLFIGLLIGNSEIGARSVSVEPFIHRKTCTNDMVVLSSWAFRHKHVGFQARLLASQIQSHTVKMFEGAHAMLEEMAGTVNDFMGHPTRTLAKLAETLKFSEGQAKDVVTAFHEDPHLSRWGAVNAITRAAQKYDADTRIDFERAAGKVIQMARHQWTDRYVTAV